MGDLLEKFKNISWSNTRFRVIAKSDKELRIAFDNLSLLGEAPRTVEIVFIQPINEWAALWRAKTNEWVDHPDLQNPIGNTVIEATAKELRKIKFSFGGNHKLGWSRWGFSVDSFYIVNDNG